VTDPFVGQLVSLCRMHVTRSKWVFVPSHAIGHTIGERIALSGTNWLNLRMVTPLDVALRMGAPFLVERGIEPSEEGLGPALMMRLLLDLPEQGGYFRPLAEQPSMAQALWTTIRELRMAGVESSDLRADMFGSPEKHRELRALLLAYERFLSDSGRGDMAVVYQEAVKHPDWCPIQPEDCWTELPDAGWSPLQRRLIDAMPGERVIPRAPDIPGASIPRRLDTRAVERVTPDIDTTPLAFLLAPAGAPGNTARGTSTPHAASSTGPSHSTVRTPHLFHAGSRDAEIEEVWRRILARGASLDQIEIACASDAHLALVWEKALRHEWPVTLGPGIPAASTRPGRAVLGLCDWVETDFSAAHLRRLLQSGDLGIEEDDEGFTAGEAARTLARAEAGWGRDTYPLALGLLEKSYQSRARNHDLADDEREAAREKAALTAKIAAWITEIVAAVPEPSARGTVALQDAVSIALRFLEHTTARVSQLDYRSAAALIDHVKELRALGPFDCSLGEALRFIRERVESLQVAPERPRPGHLYACRLQHAGFTGRPHLFIVGLEEGRVFPAASEDPVLLDAERAAISAALIQSTDRIDEAVWVVLSRLATCGSAAAGVASRSDPPSDVLDAQESSHAASVTFSYSCRDTREFRETYASWLMLQAFRLQRGDAALSYQQMKAALGEPVSILPANRDAAATDAAWWLRTVVGTGQEGIDSVAKSFAALARGREAAAHRESDQFTGFDGHVPAAGVLLDPCAPGNAFSVTDLETAASCPYRFFLKRGLGLRPLDGHERDKDVWLDPLTRGAELHDIYAALHRRCRAAARRPHLQEDGAWLMQLATDALARLNREMPPATDEILERESRDFLADVELFLEGECEQADAEPIGFEVSFGRPLGVPGDGTDEEELARAEPVEIDLGSGLTFRVAGRIDRIDKVGASEFRIVDYKTGGFWRDDWRGTFNGGRRLQHALYGLAAVELLRARYKNPKVIGAEYYFSSHKGKRERVPIAAPALAHTATVLADLRALIAEGAFVHADDADACRWCDYEAACTGSVHAQATAKLDDEKLNALRRLAAHE
jgi:RecB family exonuclease